MGYAVGVVAVVLATPLVALLEGWVQRGISVYLLPVILERQYDGFRHGHASYLSLSAFTQMLASAGLRATHAFPTPAYRS